ncbi:putative secreted protein with PEP-CTERM sorting signal [Pseudoduganella lurida]|uniref:Putative secreted protein with PEP-CTERM sorting signal n=2 Tax=Pseudoduganella lurida TaxID=1036180 RepID=A0A562R5H7_9BURK|nr:putative secreted protein with PEP-CTERM sorting signal [Pseudoduganella lurida]
MKTKQLAASLALACAALTTGAAYAADVSTPSSTVDVAEGSAFFGRWVQGVAGDSFADRYAFTLTSSSNITADLFSYTNGPGTGLDITALGLYSADGTLVLGGTQIGDAATTSHWQLTTTNLAAASYYVQVSGNVLAQPAIYSGGVVSVSAVPEPATYGMLLGGLGLVGFMARRRKAA